MKQPIFIIALILISAVCFGQTELHKKRSVYFELAGSGGLGSINYEKQFYKKYNTEFTWRAGLSIVPLDKNNGTGVVFPIMVNSITGKGIHKLELGFGQGFTITTNGGIFVLATGVVGYRHQAENTPWFYRITYTPLISYLIDLQLQHWAGISIGYTLKDKNK